MINQDKDKDLFISYGRRESLGFVARLHRLLKLLYYDAWFDKVNIPDGDDYQQRINHGIESADNFICVMAPRCLTSPYCLMELEYARLLGKRVIPINHMVIYNTTEQELSAGDQKVLAGFYKSHNLPDQNIHSSQDVLNRSLAVVGKTDWLAGQEKVSDEDCKRLVEWAEPHENKWVKHDDLDYLKSFELPVFGEPIDVLEEVVERITAVVERHKDYVHHHTQILSHALHWQKNQKATHHLLVGKERDAAEEWLLTEFLPPKQPPCQPISLMCEFICEARKNAENLMTDIFICYNVEHDKVIRDRVIQSLSRYAKTTWTHDRDIPKGYDYECAIEMGIENADNFFYFISPHAITSEYCQRELAHALKYHKRIVPLLIVPTPETDIPEILRGLQYVDFTDNTCQADYDSDIDDILNVLRHDADYYKQHKVLLVRALKWEVANGKSSFLLRGHNLDYAKTWLRLNDKRASHAPLVLHKTLITASEAAKGQLGTEVFVSYSRKNGDFARQLNAALQEAGKTTWFDQESISTGVNFEQEIFKGIDGADNFLFVISPDAVESEYCEREVNYASTQNKRFISVLHRETEPATLPESLRVINWIDFKETAFDKSFPELIQAIELDRAHAHQHTQIQQRATEWDENSQSSDFLLNTNACANAEQWLKISVAEHKQPKPTALQRDFIHKSRKAIEAAKRIERKRQIIIFSTLTCFMFSFMILSILTFVKMNEAQEAKKIAEEKTLRTESLFLASRAEDLTEKHQSLEAIAVALQALPKPYSEPDDFSRPYVGEAGVALNKALRETSKSILLEGHQAPVQNAVFSPDGKRVATASHDHTVRIWDSQTGEPLLVIQGHTDMVSGIAFEPTQGQRLVTSSKDKTARVWDSQSGEELLVLSGHDEWINFVSFSLDGQRIVTASKDKTVRIWDSQKGQLLNILSGHKDYVNTAVFSPDRKYVLTASKDKTVRIWDSQSGKSIRSLKHANVVNSAIFSPDGHQFVTASKDKTVRIWDSQSGKQLKELQGHEDNVMFAKFNPESNLLATASTDETVRLWNSQSGEQLHVLQGHKGTVSTVYFSSDGQRLVTASYDNTARIWTLLQNSKQFLTFSGHNDVINGIAFSPDGNYIATASTDKTVRVWNSQNSKLLLILKGHDDWIRTVRFSPDSRYLVTASGDKTVRFWDSQTGKQLHKLEHQESVFDAVFSSNGQHVVTASDTVRIWESQNGKLIFEFPKHNGISVRTIKYSSDEQRLLTAFTDKTARLWNSQNGEQLLELKHPSPIFAATFSPDDHFIATASRDGNTYIWNSYSGRLVLTLKGHTATVWDVNFSPNGQYIATASTDGTVRIWDSHSGQQFSSLSEKTTNYVSVFSPKGQRIATGSADSIARIYPLPPPLPKLINHTWESFWYVFTPRQREALLLYLFDIDKDIWQNLAHFDKPELASQQRLDYLWSTTWQPLTSKAKEKLSIYLLRLVWQEVLWKKVTPSQFKQLANCFSYTWQDKLPHKLPQYFHFSLLLALEKEWAGFNLKQQENIIKSLISNWADTCPAKKH